MSHSRSIDTNPPGGPIISEASSTFTTGLVTNESKELPNQNNSSNAVIGGDVSNRLSVDQHVAPPGGLASGKSKDNQVIPVVTIDAPLNSSQPPGGAKFLTPEQQVRQRIRFTLPKYTVVMMALMYEQGRKALGLSEDASLEDVQRAYDLMRAELNKSASSEEVKAKLAKLDEVYHSIHKKQLNEYKQGQPKRGGAPKQPPAARKDLSSSTRLVSSLMPAQPVEPSAPLQHLVFNEMGEALPEHRPGFNPYMAMEENIDEEKAREHHARKQPPKQDPAPAINMAEINQPRPELLVDLFMKGTVRQFRRAAVTLEEVFGTDEYPNIYGKPRTLLSLANYAQNQLILDHCYKLATLRKYTKTLSTVYKANADEKSNDDKAIYLQANKFGYSLLQLAVACNQSGHIIDDLVEKQKLNFGSTATQQEQALGASLLIIAVSESGSFEMASYLCKKGVNPNSLFVSYTRLPSTLRQERHSAYMSQDMLLIHALTMDGDVKAVTLLCELNADVNAKLRDGATPLLLAAKQKNPAMIQRLLELKAVQSIANNIGELPLIAAISQEYTSVLSPGTVKSTRLLLKHRKVPYLLTKEELLIINKNIKTKTHAALAEGLSPEILLRIPEFLLSYFSNKQNKALIKSIPHLLMLPRLLEDKEYAAHPFMKFGKQIICSAQDKDTLKQQIILQAILLTPADQISDLIEMLKKNAGIKKYLEPKKLLGVAIEAYQALSVKQENEKTHQALPAKQENPNTVRALAIISKFKLKSQLGKHNDSSVAEAKRTSYGKSK